MSYTVIDIDSNPYVYCHKKLFSSAVIGDCWNYIRNHLTSYNSNDRFNALTFVVVDKCHEFVDPPEIIKVLRKSVKNETRKVA